MKKRGYVFKIPRDENVVFMMSGGIDSSIATELCIRKWGVTVYPFYVLRGATAEKYEITALERVLKYLKTKYPRATKRLFTVRSSVPPREIKKGLSRDRVVKRGHPLRNSVMQSLAAQYGTMLSDSGKKVRTVLAGSVVSDFFAGSRSVDLRINTLYTCSNLDEWDWQISSPMLEGGLLEGKEHLEKVDLIRWGVENKFPFEITRTCTRGRKIACETCEECKERIETFREANAKDPVEYIKGC